MRENRPKQHITVAALRNGLRALDEFIGEEQLGVSEVARRLGLAKSTTYRLITTLEAEGFLTRCPRAKYRLGPRMYRLTRSLGLRRLAHQALTELHFTTSNTVQLSVLEDQMVVHIDRIEAERIVDYSALWHDPAHAAASGKVLLAFSDENVVNELIANGLAPLTARTIINPSELRAELDNVRARQYAIDREESCVGLASVAVPVQNARHTVIAAISIICPSRSFDQTTVPKLLPLLLRATHHVSAQLSTRSL